MTTIVGNQVQPTKASINTLDQALWAQIMGNLECSEISNHIAVVSKHVSRSTLLRSVWMHRTHVDFPCNSVSPANIKIILDTLHRLPNLKHAPIAQWIQPAKVTDTLLRRLLDACPDTLESLDLSYCRGVSADTLSLVTKFTKLKSLQLEGNADQVSDELLAHILPHLSALETLNIGWCTKVTSESLFSIAEHCKDIQNLDITCCRNIDDNGIIRLAQSCVQLRRLFVSQTNVTDFSMQALAENTKKIRVVHLNGCRFVSERGILTLVEQAKYLRKLELLGCVSLSQRVVQRIIDTYTHLKVERHKRELNAESRALFSDISKQLCGE